MILRTYNRRLNNMVCTCGSSLFCFMSQKCRKNRLTTAVMMMNDWENWGMNQVQMRMNSDTLQSPRGVHTHTHTSIRPLNSVSIMQTIWFAVFFVIYLNWWEMRKEREFNYGLGRFRSTPHYNRFRLKNSLGLCQLSRFIITIRNGFDENGLASNAIRIIQIKMPPNSYLLKITWAQLMIN